MAVRLLAVVHRKPPGDFGIARSRDAVGPLRQTGLFRRRASLRDFDYDVVSTQPDVLVLKAPIVHRDAQPSVSIKFLDADTYIATSSSQPFQTTGAIERCK